MRLEVRDWEYIVIYVITENKYKQFGIESIPRKVSRELEKNPVIER